MNGIHLFIALSTQTNGRDLISADNPNEIVARDYSLTERLLRHVYVIDMTCSFYYCYYWLTRIRKKAGDIFVAAISKSNGSLLVCDKQGTKIIRLFPFKVCNCLYVLPTYFTFIARHTATDVKMQFSQSTIAFVIPRAILCFVFISTFPSELKCFMCCALPPSCSLCTFSYCKPNRLRLKKLCET